MLSFECFDCSFTETNGEHHTNFGFALGKTIRFRILEFIPDRLSNLSLSLEGNDSSAVFVGMVHCRSLSLHAILEESINEDDTTSSRGGSSGFPHLSRVQRGDPDCPHHNHTTIGGHSNASDHPNGPVANRHLGARHRLLLEQQQYY
jgi:hypothetical protein